MSLRGATPRGNDSRPSRSEQRSGESGGAGTRPESRAVVSFRLGAEHYGMDARYVGEVVSVDSVTHVPLAPPAVLGLFNLRGVPLALVDLAIVLGNEEASAKKAHRPDEGTALVLNSNELAVAVRIDGMEGVLTLRSAEELVPPAEADPLVIGFIETMGRAGVVTLLNETEVFSRLGRLKLWQ